MRDSDWKILHTLYRLQNITKAANQLFMTQPALTKRIRAMETEWGGALIESNNKGIRFTPLGEYLAISSQEILTVLDKIHDHVSAESSGAVGTLKIGAPTSFIRFHLPKLIRCYKAEFPNVDFSITTCLSDSVPKLISEHHVQIGFFCGNYPYEGNVHLLGQSRCYLVSREPLDLERLPEYPRIEYIKGYLTMQMQERWWQERFKEPMRVDYMVHQADACLEMIQQGLGYGFFSMDYNFASAYPLLSVQPLSYSDGSPMVRNDYMLYNEKDSRYPLVHNFIEYVKTHQDYWYMDTKI